LVITFFCLYLFSIGLVLFGNFILFAFHLHNKWEECPAHKGGGGVGVFANLKVKNKIWTC
jgi:hypothetical protein